MGGERVEEVERSEKKFADIVTNEYRHQLMYF